MTEPSPALTRFSLDGADADASDCAAFLANQSPLDGQAAAWLVRRQDGLCAEEERAFQAWLALDPSHPAALVRLQGVWRRIDALPSEGVALLKASVEAARSAPAASPSTAREARQPTQPSHRPGPPARPSGLFGLFGLGRWGASFLPQMASAAVAFAVVGGTWFAWDHWQQQPVFTQTYATARGQQLDVRLPDGTAMKLDTGTRAEVTLYRQRREVRLPQGQALFSVKADAKQPFSVWAGQLRITVVGTRFSVRNTATGLMSEGASVVVEEGRVRVSTVG
ncbi:MAG TPA: FecR domain-containing protein, partial [Hydrogenophaga sp.]